MLVRKSKRSDYGRLHLCTTSTFYLTKISTNYTHTSFAMFCHHLFHHRLFRHRLFRHCLFCHHFPATMWSRGQSRERCRSALNASGLLSQSSMSTGKTLAVGPDGLNKYQRYRRRFGTPCNISLAAAHRYFRHPEINLKRARTRTRTTKALR